MGAGEDRISALPDELLHTILVRLRCARAAARTGVLSRRWRPVWTSLPELFLTIDGGRNASDAVDAALAAFSTTAAPLERLYILSRDGGGREVRASDAAPWLRYASEHVVGELHLFVPTPKVGGEEELELPACPRAKAIMLDIPRSWRLRPQLPGLFAALTTLKIYDGRMEASELTGLVSRHCPVLRDMAIFVDLVAVSDVSVLSNSLQSLQFLVRNTRRLEVIAPALEMLLVVCEVTEALISCPKLAELIWNGGNNDHRHHKFEGAGHIHRHLHLLEIERNSGEASLPELFLTLNGSNGPDPIDAALAAFSATSAPVERLYILTRSRGGGSGNSREVRASHAAPWLRFASEHVVGELCLFVPAPEVFVPAPEVDEEEEFKLPACPRAKAIRLSIPYSWWLRPQPPGLFAALTSLQIDYGRMEASELTDLVSKHCPVLTDLDISVSLVALSDVSVLSNSLQSLQFIVRNTRRLEVITPRLEKLLVCQVTKAHISCPKLAELVWEADTFDHRHHKFEGARRYLQLLEIDEISAAASLMRQFVEVDELKLQIYIPWEMAKYESLLNERSQLPKCRTLDISLLWSSYHGIAPAILHLMRKCYSARKVSVKFYCDPFSEHDSCELPCPCRSAESGRIDVIDLSFLEEVELDNFASSDDELEFLEQLSKCNATVLRKLVINYARYTATPLTKAIREKVRNMWRPSVNVEFYVFLDGRRVCFD